MRAAAPSRSSAFSGSSSTTNNGKFTAYSVIPRPFATKPTTGTCAKPINLAATPISHSTTKLYWSFSPSATKYYVRYRDLSISPAAWVTKTINSATPGTAVAGLTPGANYAFQVRSLCPPYGLTNWTTYTSLGYFTQPVAPGECPTYNGGGGQIMQAPVAQSTTPLGMQTSKVSVAPNPTNGELRVSYEGGEAADLYLLDATGRQVKTWRNVPQGDVIDLGSLPQGLYLLQAILPNQQRVTTRIVKM